MKNNRAKKIAKFLGIVIISLMVLVNTSLASQGNESEECKTTYEKLQDRNEDSEGRVFYSSTDTYEIPICHEEPVIHAQVVSSIDEAMN